MARATLFVTETEVMVLILRISKVPSRRVTFSPPGPDFVTYCFNTRTDPAQKASLLDQERRFPYTA